MEKQLKKLGLILWFLFAFYSILSYLIFLRNDFLLERISILTQAPWLLDLGRRWGKLLHVNSIPTPLYFLIITAMFIVYARALSILKKNRSKKKETTKTIIKFSILFMITTLISFPSLSTDVFDYIATNRVLFVHQANPWLRAPQEFPQDDFIYLGSWKFRASVYGPVQFLFSSVVHIFAGDSIIANVAGFKLINSLFMIATIFLVKKFLEEKNQSHLAFGLLLFAWNPLLHIEIAGNAHNDIIMTFFALSGLYLIFTKRESLGALALALAVLSKIATVIFIPIITVWLILENRKKQALKFLGTFIISTSVGFAILRGGFIGFIKNLGVQLGLYLRSLPTILRFLFLKVGLSDSKAMMIEKLFTIPPFAALFLIVIKKLKSLGLSPALVITMLGYLILASPMLQPWYLVWVLPFIALLPPGRLLNGALIFTYSSLVYYAVLFISFYFSPLNFAWQIAMFTVVVIPPLFVWFTPKTWYTQLRRQR
jgi:hypothetical protein